MEGERPRQSLPAHEEPARSPYQCEDPVKLRIEFDELREAVRLRVHRQLRHRTSRAATVHWFAVKSFATVTGWFTAHTLNAFLIIAIRGSSDVHDLDQLIARGIYAIFISIAVPLALWLLSVAKTEDEDVSIKRTQVELLKGCLPCLVAWGLNDFTKELLNVIDHEVWPEICCAVALTLLVALGEWAPWYRRAIAATQREASIAGLSAQFAVLPKYFSLAVGFAWNHLFKWPVIELQRHVHAVLFKFMIQVLYFILATTAISFMTARWSSRLQKLGKNMAEKPVGSDVRKQATQSDPCQMGTLADNAAVKKSVYSDVLEVSSMAGHVIIDSMHFVYAWAVLDTINELFFRFLLGCPGPRGCGYTTNFGFALFLTIAFTTWACFLKSEHRTEEWSIVDTNLWLNSFSLSVAWAWANFCFTAIHDALLIDEVSQEGTWLILLVFVWLAISYLYHRFMIEYVAWARYIVEDASGHDIDDAAGIDTSVCVHEGEVAKIILDLSTEAECTRET